MSVSIRSNKRILIIGPYPPPYGGVSIHIFRFYNLLKEEFSFDFIDESPNKKSDFFNIRGLNIVGYLKKIGNSDILYVHSGSNLIRILHLLVGRIYSKKIILVLHGFTSKPPKFIFYINGLIYRLATTIIVVNGDIRKRLYLSEKKSIIKEAFIPPFLIDELELPENILKLICQSKRNGKIIICSNAFRLKKYMNQDLYGLDMCIEVAKRLVNKEISFIFIFVVSSVAEKNETYLKMETLIKELNLEKHFFLINENLSFVKLMQQSDIVIRPTNTDGDSLTIREGLFLNKKVLASDVVQRPEGVILFENRNMNDLEKKLVELISSGDKVNGKMYQQDHENLHKTLKKFYCHLIDNL